MKNLLNIKNLTILFFITIFLLGLNLYQDYGVYFDNTYQRINALLWYSYVKSFFLEPGLLLTDNLKNLGTFRPPSIRAFSPLGKRVKVASPRPKK